MQPSAQGTWCSAQWGSAARRVVRVLGCAWHRALGWSAQASAPPVAPAPLTSSCSQSPCQLHGQLCAPGEVAQLDSCNNCTCISSAMVGTSEPCPGAPGVSRLGLRDHRRCGPFGDQLLRWCRREAGVQGGSDLAPTCCAYPGSGLWLEPLDPVEPLQPQLQRRHLAALPGGHCVPGCLWWCCVPGPQNPPERSQGHS